MPTLSSPDKSSSLETPPPMGDYPYSVPIATDDKGEQGMTMSTLNINSDYLSLQRKRRVSTECEKSSTFNLCSLQVYAMMALRSEYSTTEFRFNINLILFLFLCRPQGEYRMEWIQV